jgi:hypothetical protein
MRTLLTRALFLLISLFPACHSVLADETISLGLTLKIPSQGQTNWGALFRDNFAEPISSHDHTGGGKGLQLSTNALADNAISASKVRLANDQYFRARNFANDGDVNLIKANASNKIAFGANIASATIEGGTITGITDLAPADGGTGISSVPTNGQLLIGNGTNYTAAALTGTANQISVTNGAGSITLATPQNIGTNSSPEFTGVLLNGLTASKPVFTDGSKNLTSSGTMPVAQGGTGLTGTPSNGQLPIGNGTGYTLAALTGTANQVTVTNGGGSITLALPQSIHTAATPTFTGLNAAWVRTGTSDGSDNQSLNVGHTDSTRGGGIDFFGNEHATAPGAIQLRAGASSTIGFAAGITTTVVFDGPSLRPLVDAGADLGTASEAWDDVYADQFILSSAPDYTVFDTAADRRSIDPTAGGLTVAQVAEIVDTMVQDLVAAGIFQ